MKKIFISQPMRGRESETIEAQREMIVDVCKKEYENVAFVDSYINNDTTSVRLPLWNLGESLKRMAAADAVYFADGWEQARGCRIEHQAAVDYGIEIIRD